MATATAPATVKEYVDALPEERKSAINKIRKVIKNNLPAGFKETIQYGMIGYVVPKKTYPNGYHCDTSLALPFIHLASQKTGISLYHFGIYTNEKVMKWFTKEYPNHAKRKLDMGKSCIRFKKIDDIPYDLIGELATKMTAEDWIKLYEKHVKPS